MEYTSFNNYNVLVGKQKSLVEQLELELNMIKRIALKPKIAMSIESVNLLKVISDNDKTELKNLNMKDIRNLSGKMIIMSHFSNLIETMFPPEKQNHYDTVKKEYKKFNQYQSKINDIKEKVDTLNKDMSDKDKKILNELHNIK